MRAVHACSACVQSEECMRVSSISPYLLPHTSAYMSAYMCDNMSGSRALRMMAAGNVKNKALMRTSGAIACVLRALARLPRSGLTHIPDVPMI